MKQIKEIINNKTTKNTLFSILGTIGIVKAYELTSVANLTNNIMNIFIFIMLINIYEKNEKYEKKERIFSYCYSMFLSIILIIGTQLDTQGEIIWSLMTLIKIICLTFTIIPITLYSVNLIKKVNPNKIKLNKKKMAILIFITIFLFNFLVFLALYPGVYGYDAGFQILEVRNNKVQLTSHFSVLFSVILADCVNLGKTLFNNYQTGLAIFALLQMTFMTYVATRISLYVINKTKNKILFTISMLFFCLFPPYTIMTISTIQDVMFAGISALIVLNLIELANNKKYYDKKLNPIKLIVLITLACILRNNGVYAILVTIPFILIFKKDKKILTLIILTIPIITYKIYTGPIHKIMKVKNEPSTREIVSIPSQQLARVYNYNYGILNKKDLETYDRYYLNLENFEYYLINPEIADLIKAELNVQETKDNFANYLQFWVGIGIKDPENYIEAFLLNNLATWYPNKTYADYRMYHPYIEYNMLDAKKWNKDYIEIKRSSKFPLYEKILRLTIEKNAWKKVPIISTAFTPGFYFLIYIYTLGICIIKKKTHYIIPLSYLAGIYATVIMAPVSLFRYCFPIIILAPVMMSIITEKEK